MPTKNFIPTDRDTRMVVELGEAGLMSTPMLVDRHFQGFRNQDSAERAFRRRLKVFQEAGIIESATIAVRHRTGGTALAIHTLTVAGADFLEELTGTRPRRPGVSLDLSPVMLPHRLGVLATRLTFDDAHRAGGLPLPEWIHEYDLHPGVEATARNDQKFVLYESFQRNGGRLVCWPDAAARIHFDQHGRHELLIYLEYDRSTETSRQIAAKSEPYQLLVHERRYWRHWDQSVGEQVVRVLFVGRSEQRLIHAIAAIQGTPGEKLFRFATYSEMAPATLLNAPIWRTVDGQRLAILKSPTR